MKRYSFEESKMEPRSRRCLCLWVVFVIGMIYAVVTLVLLTMILTKASSSEQDQRSQRQCIKEDVDVASAPKEMRLFEPLSESELRRVRDFLFEQKELSLVPIVQALPSDNYIHFIQLHMPNKSEAISHLDGGASIPERKAMAVVVLGSIGVVYELIVGPTSNPTYYSRYKNPAYRKDIPSYSIPALLPEEIQRTRVLQDMCTQLSDILLTSFNLQCCGPERAKDCILFGFKAPYGEKSGERFVWYQGFRSVEGESVNPLPFQTMVDCNERNHTKWKIGAIYYSKTLYKSIDAFKAGYENGDKLVLPKRDSTITSMASRGSPLPKNNQRGPRVVEPDGNRFKVDGHHISYMNWELDFANRVVDGLQLQDIRYDGERILYELGQKEALAQYGGNTPGAQHTKYYDGSWLMGSMMRPMMRGVDCPETAVFIDEYLFAGSDDVIYKPRSICVFEFYTSSPQRRHYSTQEFVQSENVYSGSPDYYLVVRSILTVWNYDYVFDYMFHVDGVIEVKIGLTGYIQAEPVSDGGDKYGFQITPGAIGLVHNHILSFRADFDIGGRENRFVAYNVDGENIEANFRDDKKKIWQRKISRTEFKREKDAALKYNFEKPKYYLVESVAAPAPGRPRRSYRIGLSSLTKVTVPVDTDAMRAARWSDYQIACTKHKDEEQSSTTPYAQNEPFDPVLDWNDFIEDNEDIDGEDLVTWLTIGLMHIPHTEDLPVTTTSAATIGFKLLPYNYFESDPSMGLRDAVRATPGDEGRSLVETQFNEEDTCVYNSYTDSSYPNLWTV